MASRNFSVRLFEIDKEGSLEPILAVDEDYFAGTVPNVGDTYSTHGLDDYTFYAVQRRIFVDSHDGAGGWLIIVRKVDATSLLENVVSAWQEDTQFWNEIDQQESMEEGERRKQDREDRDEYAPRHNLHPREVLALRFMIEHPDCNTVDVIPQAGEHTINVLAAAALIRPGGKNHSGQKTWRVTEEGNAEIERRDKLSSWKF
ncbi:hypothetical protein [Rhizobium sp. CCGE 510]|uniref:hypothetical protein n=1 Tax=Rhizobium sp. CCGE 510 TaxID=1132836 RepID=UPI00027B7E25|nr:hypothetical protein [Rhizobium sp. CCGE 510]EJT05687.1 hypothetical protein RCCGE510_07161 [Rhizobium sp. CCGE 510]